ncbi:DNA repair and recombination protein, putative helicase [hydrothermal vent metagenome]|uniref:DNA repair and recombination protein, putative helicase n=1 Tax=hydrothermal vent metagenome TaxID=652676 RepID=A0A3B0VXK0_9ZZZZ
MSQVPNPELELAWNFVEKTDKSIYLTGKAGTGKTTFLHAIKAQSLKRLIVVAPTGVAAINAKGVTIHSFFQLPFGPIIPDGSQFQHRGNYKMKFGRQKIDIIRSLDLLIIDEISMVRADLLDAIDQVLRRYKDRNKVFGGVQVLMIGDLQQLAPVVKPDEWSLLAPYYHTIFFFSSQAYQQADTIAIELQHIYRQDNQRFIAILNEIRNNRLSPSSAAELNKRYLPDFTPQEQEGYITLTTHNNRAHKMNNIELSKLSSQSFIYAATIKGKFNEHAFPTDVKLELKLGAQVMFIKNDSSPEKRYFNGKMGIIVQIDSDEVRVKCPTDDEVIIVTPEIWENVKYSINPDSKAITEDCVGSFTQIPLRLAWAITIHKSQGLTFDKVIIDAEASFAHGQTYVALSRCRTLDGVVLKSKINDSSIITDQSVSSYINAVKDNPPTSNDLLQSQKTYQLNLMADLFDYSQFTYPLKRSISIYYQNKNSLEGKLIEALRAILDFGVNHLLQVNANFQKQLIALSATIDLPENDPTIQDRLQKAIAYFLEKTNQLIATPFSNLSFSTENQEVKKNLNQQIQIITELLANKLHCLNGLTAGFDSKNYLQLRTATALQNLKSSKPKKEYIDSTEHPELFAELKDFRSKISQAQELPAFNIFTQKTLYEMCRHFPTTTKHLQDIHGMGKIRIEKYGQAIVSIIQKYAEKHNLESREITEKPKKLSPKKGATQQQTLALFKQGLSIPEIAKQRGYVESTIESHLAKFIGSGEIHITELLQKDRYQQLKQLIGKLKFEGLSDLKTQMRDEYSYGEIRMALMAMEHETREA